MQEEMSEGLASVLRQDRVAIEQRWYSVLSHLPLAGGSLEGYRARYDLAALLGEGLHDAFVQGEWGPLSRVVSREVARFRPTFTTAELQRIVASYREAARPSVLARVRGDALREALETLDRCLDSVVYQIGQTSVQLPEAPPATPMSSEALGGRLGFGRLVKDVQTPLETITVAARSLAGHLQDTDAEGRRQIEHISRKVVEINSLLTAFFAEASLPAEVEVSSAAAVAVGEHRSEGC